MVQLAPFNSHCSSSSFTAPRIGNSHAEWKLISLFKWPLGYKCRSITCNHCSLVLWSHDHCAKYIYIWGKTERYFVSSFVLYEHILTTMKNTVHISLYLPVLCLHVDDCFYVYVSLFSLYRAGKMHLYHSLPCTIDQCAHTYAFYQLQFLLEPNVWLFQLDLCVMCSLHIFAGDIHHRNTQTLIE